MSVCLSRVLGRGIVFVWGFGVPILCGLQQGGRGGSLLTLQLRLGWLGCCVYAVVAVSVAVCRLVGLGATGRGGVLLWGQLFLFSTFLLSLSPCLLSAPLGPAHLSHYGCPSQLNLFGPHTTLNLLEIQNFRNATLFFQHPENFLKDFRA